MSKCGSFSSPWSSNTQHGGEEHGEGKRAEEKGDRTTRLWNHKENLPQSPQKRKLEWRPELGEMRLQSTLNDVPYSGLGLHRLLLVKVSLWLSFVFCIYPQKQILLSVHPHLTLMPTYSKNPGNLLLCHWGSPLLTHPSDYLVALSK